MRITLEQTPAELRMRLDPEDEMERLQLRMMAERSEKGTTTIFAGPALGQTEYVLAIAK